MSVTVGVEVDHSPARISSVLSVMAALVAVVSVAFSSVLAVLLGVLGLLGVAGGLFALESRTGVVVGCGVLFLGVLVSGLTGAPTVLLLSATVGTVLAMDLGQNAVSVGRQLSADTYTRRGEFVHAGASTVVGVLVAGLGYGMFLVSPGGQPVGALVLLLLAATLLLWSVRT